MLVVTPITFGSNVVDPTTMPGWLLGFDVFATLTMRRYGHAR